MRLSPPLTVTFLGSGTSTGVPMIGCDCAVCRSGDPRDKRTRPSLLVTVGTGEDARRILVDTTPEMRLQMLRQGIDRVDAVLVTHTHADHIFGMDDIRQFNWRLQRPMPIYGTEETLGHLRRVFDYCFKETQVGGGKPQLVLEPLTPHVPFDLLGVTVTPLTVLHGRMPVTAFKFGDRFAYLTDVSVIPDEARAHLTGLDTLILGAVRYEKHPTHFTLSEAVEEARRFAPRQTYLTHLSHHFLHREVDAALPPGINLGYDGLTFAVPESAAAPGSDAP
jgi:Metal-dependent hydrolases of the beta-lactamase superfamily I